jgi:hypothetical protein
MIATLGNGCGCLRAALLWQPAFNTLSGADGNKYILDYNLEKSQKLTGIKGVPPKTIS